MASRHAVLLTPSLSSRPIQPLSCTQIARETPLIPVFVFKTLRTLSFSVSAKSCVCRSYENGRVCTNNSHSGTLRRALANLPLNSFDGGASRFFPSADFALSATGVCPDPVGALNPSFFSRLSTFNFQLSTSPSLIPFLFKLLRTLLHSAKSQLLCFHGIPDSLHKTPGGGGTATPACSNFRSLPRFTGLRDTTHDSFWLEDSPSGNSVGSAGGASAMASSSG